jgi:hypothetical protein
LNLLIEAFSRPDKKDHFVRSPSVGQMKIVWSQARLLGFPTSHNGAKEMEKSSCGFNHLVGLLHVSVLHFHVLWNT